MHKRLFITAVAMTVTLALPLAAHAQEWRGMGRVGGKVVDEGGKTLEGVVVRATMPEAGGRGPAEIKSNSKGDWAVGGLRSGLWDLDFVKDGYETRSMSLPVSEVNRGRPMEVVLKKAAPPPPDANVMLKAKLTEAADLMNARKFAEARAIYEALTAEHPEIKEFKPLIARAHYGEGNKDKAIALLREASTEDPNNIEVRLLLGTLLVEAGEGEEAQKILASIDDAAVEDPVVLLNLGIGMINEGRHADAIPWFTRAITRFPNHPDAYYYRGLAHLATDKRAEAKADLEQFIAIAKPDAPELPAAKQMLVSIK